MLNAVLVAVLVMLGLSLLRVHVVLSLLVSALLGGLLSGLGLPRTLEVFQEGLAGGAEIALSYALLGAFAVAIIESGVPRQLSAWLTGRLAATQGGTGAARLKWGLLLGLLSMSVMSQNLIPIHIAFIPMLIPPLLAVFNRLELDRRLLACVMTFGLVTTYMLLPYGFGEIFLGQILLGNIQKAGMDVSGVNVMQAMAIPALGMVAGLLLALFSYRRPRRYQDLSAAGQDLSAVGAAEPDAVPAPSPFRTAVTLSAVVAAFAVQLLTDSLMIGALAGFAVFLATGILRLRDADGVFNRGIGLMAMIGFIMITAQGFAAVMQATGQIEPLVQATSDLFAGSRPLAALAMLLVGLLVTMGIGSSFSTLPIITAIYVPLCMGLGFSPLATVAIIGTAGALGDAGSPASDSTLGPTAGLNVDGQHDHIRDTVIPTFLHYNLPLLLAGWVAALVL
ncbi:Na+/H+ antiporter family protein [Deinococcus sp. SL84]|uniref:Na+/H+ antiporter family protein n=1 Tax=Deinococcus sp. SL84 TaxID=2994663 RepID=UPI0022744C32|nr:Na+/H+ antiporter NhaC family protein [Deinococcus sp. SL84]MCY1702570.1 sodium:proton antiporter [Deinococcus sp. SL84]